MAPPKQTPRPIRVEGDIAYVPLTQGYEAVIDASDAKLVEAWAWFAIVHRRANGDVKFIQPVRRGPMVGGRQPNIQMNRAIIAAPDDLCVNHIDRDGLNCRRANLRLSSRAESSYGHTLHCNNTSGSKGVWYEPLRGKWRARIAADNKEHYLGQFDDRASAEQAYAAASLRFHGEFGRLS